jgi:hypothetical protein
MMQNPKFEEAQKSLEKLFSSPSYIIEKANEYRERSSFKDSEREIPYYYFMLKHFVAIHESCFETIPIQIHNEHRMALDHFIRARTNHHEEHTKSVIGHLRRAVLDIVKLNCAGLREEMDKRQNAIPKKALGLVSNGDYIKNYIKKQNEAESLLNEARCEDHKIGNNIELNEEIVNLYVKAYVAHYEWYKFQCENMGNALFIKTRYYVLIGLPVLISFLVGFAVNIVYGYLKQIFGN